MTAPWTRIHLSKLEQVRSRASNHNVFTTIQLFKGDKQADGELQFVPLYFDLDYKDDVNIALVEARKLVAYFTTMGIGQEHVRVWFSGSKGFHIVVTPELFGIKPHAELTYIIKNACTYVSSQLKLVSFDTRVYSIRRMWRMAGSVHQKTGLYCTELSHQELDETLDTIKELAKVRRDDLYEPEEYERVDENNTCAAWFVPFVQDYETQKELQNLRPKVPIVAFAGENPVCITDLLTNSIRKSGTRNQGEMALVSYYKDTGTDASVAQAMVTAWAETIPKGLTSKTDKRSLEADVKGVVKTVYDGDHGDKYHFACAFIRSLGTGTNKPIACAHDKCKFIKQEDQEPAEAIHLKLPEASRSVYIGKKITADVMISGREDIPYGIPVRIRISCQPDLARENSVCKVCPLAVFGGNYEFKFTAKDQGILGLLDTSDQQQKGFLRKRCGIPDRCARHRIEVLEYANAIEVMAIPRIDFRPDTITEDEPYVLRRGLFIGHDIEANKEYSVSAYTYPDPKTQHLVHVIEEVRPLTDDIAMFKADETVMLSLKKFEITVPLPSLNGNGAKGKN